MSTHNPHHPEDHRPEEIDATHGYERSDVRASGIIVFLTAMAIFVAVIGILAYGLGKVLDMRMAKDDGPRSKWADPVDVRKLGNLPSSPDLQNKMAELTQRFPTPRLQTDDGLQDVADLHRREDLLLQNYTWVDRTLGKVRIPIERAMELVAEKGLPVAPAVQQQPLMTGDTQPAIATPLTNGFARTAYEQEQNASQTAEARHAALEK